MFFGVIVAECYRFFVYSILVVLTGTVACKSVYPLYSADFSAGYAYIGLLMGSMFRFGFGLRVMICSGGLCVFSENFFASIFTGSDTIFVLTSCDILFWASMGLTTNLFSLSISAKLLTSITFT